jgi:O-antigen/teichoic acid export membrane protein
MRDRWLQLGRDAVIYALGLGLRRGLGIVTLPVFARHLAPAQFGTLAVLGTLRDLLAVVFELGTPNASVRFYYDCGTDAERRRLFGSLQIFLAVTSTLFTLLALALGPRLWAAVAPEIPFHPYASLTILTVFLTGSSILPRGLLRVTHRVSLFAGLSLAQGVLSAALCITLVVGYDLGALGAVIGNLVVAAIFAPVQLAFLRGRLTWRVSPGLVRRCLAFGINDVPVRVGAWALRLADRLILQAYVPLSAVGVYSMGYMLGSTGFELIGSAVNAAILPFFYRVAADETPARAQAIFARLAAWHVALFGFLGLALSLFAREIILLFATARYLAAEPIVQLVVWASVALTLAQIPLRAVYTAKRTANLPVVFLVPAALNVTLNFVWIPHHGILGAAAATAVAYPLMTVLQFWAAQRVYPIPYPYARMAAALAVAVLLAAVGWLASPDDRLAEASLQLALLTAYPALLWLTGFMPADERRAGVAFVGAMLRRRRAAAIPDPRPAPPAPDATEKTCERHSSTLSSP